MKTLSTGQPSTLASYREMAAALFAEDSAPVRFIDSKIKEQGAEMEVIADESQMIFVLARLFIDSQSGQPPEEGKA